MPAMWKPGGDKPRAAGDKPKQQPRRRDDGEGAKIAGSALPPRESAAPRPKATLSQKTLAMKFMQRKKHTEADRRAALQARKRQDEWVDEQPAAEDESAIVCVADVADPSLPLVFGRRSFGGFNKGVEDEFKEVTRQLKYTESEEKAAREEVSAEEMASRMGRYTGLHRGGGNRGNHSSSSQRKRQRK